MIKNYFMIDYIKKYITPITIGIVIILALPILTLPIPIFMMKIIDTYIPNKNITNIENYGLIILTLFTLNRVLSYIQTIIFYKYNCKIVKDIRVDLFSKIFHGKLTQTNKFKGGDICTRIEDDIKNLNVLFINNIADIIKDSFTFLVCFIMMIRISIIFTAIFICILIYLYKCNHIF